MTDEPRAGSEAARLLAAAQDWLRTSAPHLAPVDVDGSPCSCPLCRVVANVREADPDDVARFVDSAVTALSSLAGQAADLAGSVRGQAATWASPDSYAGDDDDDDDAPGYAVDVDDAEPADASGADVEPDADADADADADSDSDEDADEDADVDEPGRRTVHRIRIEHDD